MAGIKRWLMARKWVIQEVLQVQAPDTPIPGGGQMTPHTLHVSYVFGDDGWHLYTWEADGPHVDDQGEIVDGDDARSTGTGRSPTQVSATTATTMGVPPVIHPSGSSTWRVSGRSNTPLRRRSGRRRVRRLRGLPGWTTC